MPPVRCPRCNHEILPDGWGCAPWCPDNDGVDDVEVS